MFQQHSLSTVSTSEKSPVVLQTINHLYLHLNTCFALFSKKSVKRQINLIHSVEDKATLIKKNIVYFSRIRDFDRIITYLKDLPRSYFTNLDQSFFYLTAQKFANQTVQQFFDFFQQMTRIYSFDG